MEDFGPPIVGFIVMSLFDKFIVGLYNHRFCGVWINPNMGLTFCVSS